MARLVPFGLLAAALLLATPSCRKPHGPRARPTEGAVPTRGGGLHLATYSDLRSLDPAVAYDTDVQPFLELLYAGLVDYDDDGKLVGDLAERWEISEDRRTYRFFLRHGVRMHDGTELSADDVQRTIERTLHPKTPCPGAEFFQRIDGFDAFHDGTSEHLAGVWVESPHVVSIRLSIPDPSFLAVLALPFLRPVCKSGGTRYSDDFQTHACGAGPFRLESWVPGRHLRLRRHDGYHVEGRPYLDTIEMRMDVSRLSQRFSFLSGEQDAILNEWDRPGVLYFRTHPEWSRYITTITDSSIYGDFMNVEMAPFTDVRVRKAVAAALDRRNLQLYYDGWAVVTGHMIPPGIPGHLHDPPWAQRSDLPRARALMAEAGYPYDPVTRKGGYPHVVQYYAGEGESAVRYAQILQYDLAQIGLRIEVKETSFAQWQALTGRPKTVTMGYAGWSLDYPDPSNFFEPMLTSRAITDEESENHAFYRNRAFDDLVFRAHGELDATKRIAMYHEAERIICDEAPWSFAYNPVRVDGVQPWVRGYREHPVWQKYVRNVWIDTKAKGEKTALLHPSNAGAALGVIFRHARPGIGR